MASQPSLWGGAVTRAYYSDPKPCAADKGDVPDTRCKAQTQKGGRCKKAVSELNPARSLGVCDVHGGVPDFVDYTLAHPQTTGPKAKVATHFNIYVTPFVTVGGVKMVCPEMLVQASLKAVRKAIAEVGVPMDTKVEVVLTPNSKGCGGPFPQYGAKPTREADPDACGYITKPPVPPEKFATIEISMPNPNKKQYTTPADFFSSAEGGMIVSKLESVELAAAYRSFDVDGEEARMQLEAIPKMIVDGGPCDAAKFNATKY